jgi:hypothetical protein
MVEKNKMRLYQKQKKLTTKATKDLHKVHKWLNNKALALCALCFPGALCGKKILLIQPLRSLTIDRVQYYLSESVAKFKI